MISRGTTISTCQEMQMVRSCVMIQMGEELVNSWKDLKRLKRGRMFTTPTLLPFCSPRLCCFLPNRSKGSKGSGTGVTVGTKISHGYSRSCGCERNCSVSINGLWQTPLGDARHR